jgi:Fe-Mn family superoxide dismutase
MIQLPELPYPRDALEPVISQIAMATHHDKHHAKYVETANRLAGKAVDGLSLETLISRAEVSGDKALFNAAAQAWNHGFFWNCMTPHPVRRTKAVDSAIISAFGDVATLRAAFLAEGATHFGSGWIWLAMVENELRLFTTHDAGTVVTMDATPLLVCDLWEHAYYLDYRNARADYLETWWDRLANWDFADAQLTAPKARRWRYPTVTETYVSPIHNHHAFERALEEAGMLLESPPEARSPQAFRFGALLGRIADYDRLAPEVGSVAAVAEDLDRKIRAAARRSAARRPANERHWDPMLGGDVHPPAPPHPETP